MFCTDIPSPIALIFSSSTPALLYYSHLPVVFTAIMVGLLVYSKNKSLESKLLLAMATLFSLWNFVDLINWTNVDSRIIMLSWSFMNFLFILVPAATLYFCYVFLEKRDAPFRYTLFSFLLLLPFLIAIPTILNMTGFDLSICEAQEGVLLYYFHFLQGFFLLWLLFYLVGRCFKSTGEHRKQTILLSVGIIFFILSFYWGNLVGSLAEEWEWEQYGLFGMLIFMSCIVFLIVRYKAFDMKIVAAQALMGGFIILIGAQFFFVESNVNLILVAITFLLSIIFAYFLIRSVKLDVIRKEELQEIASRLGLANDELRRLDNAKSEFISIASHQLRTPLTAIKGFVSLLLEGAYGKIEPAVGDALNKVYLANARLMNLVENLLNISRIEAGRIQYQFKETKLEDILNELKDLFGLAAHAKNLKLTLVISPALPKMMIDGPKIREVISNLIDNSVKYTNKGEIIVTAEKSGDHVLVTVSDTGIGIDPDDLPHLFNKFERGKDAAQVNVSSTGLGLYVGRSFVEAHDGKIWAESEGPRKGARFIIQLPIKRKKEKA